MGSYIYQITNISDFTNEIIELGTDGLIDVILGLSAPVPPVLVIFVISLSCLLIKKIAFMIRS